MKSGLYVEVKSVQRQELGDDSVLLVIKNDVFFFFFFLFLIFVGFLLLGCGNRNE